jgi:hypothetical protein
LWVDYEKGEMLAIFKEYSPKLYSKSDAGFELIEEDAFRQR